MMSTVLQARDLTRYYDVAQGFLKPAAQVKALNGVSFELQAGKTLAVVGESGCGKSTLARQLTLIEPPTSGSLLLEGQDAATAGKAELKAMRTKVQMVFQNPYASLNPRQKIGTQLGEPLAINTSLSASEREERVRAMMTRVGLRPEHYYRYPHMFSGGQRQRIAIARAMMLNPKIVVADEPTSALDVSIQAQVLNLFMDLQEEFNTAYVFISHNLAVVEHVADDLMVMYLGRAVEVVPRARFTPGRCILIPRRCCRPRLPFTRKIAASRSRSRANCPARSIRPPAALSTSAVRLPMRAASRKCRNCVRWMRA
jgi:dipeptide transport system ATP-binding protein